MAAPPEGDVMTGRMTTILAMFGSVALVLAGSEYGTPSYIWNASESVPVGLYRLQPVLRWSVTELVAIKPPEPLGTFLDLNGYLPIGVPMLKRILALPGQTVCRTGLAITVDDIEIGHARERDGRGRPLPVWQGCRLLLTGEIFVMNWQSPDSFDGRYFGPIPASAVIGQAIPVWTEGE
jgi:conjugative transfer signal peptidase TraF